jgi:hypothetical protein
MTSEQIEFNLADALKNDWKVGIILMNGDKFELYKLKENLDDFIIAQNFEQRKESIESYYQATIVYKKYIKSIISIELEKADLTSTI